MAGRGKRVRAGRERAFSELQLDASCLWDIVPFACVSVSCGSATHPHQLGDLKQRWFITLQFWRPEIQGRSHGWKVSAGPVPSGGPSGESFLLPFLEWMLSPSVHHKALSASSVPSASPHSDPPASRLEGSLELHWAHRIIQDNVPISRPLT